MSHLSTIKLSILFIYVISVAYTQFRGKVRLKFFRQIVNHSTFIAPINALMYMFSGVPNQPFYDPKDFPELNILRDNWEVMRAEAQQLVDLGYIKAAEHNNDMGFNSFFKRGWKRFYLKWYDNFLPSAATLCPQTCNLLKNIPNIHGAMFTMLPQDGGRLKPHRDPYAGSLRYHLGLITPNSENCRILVDGTLYYWQDGKDVMFDETYIHSARNDTDIDRVILFCDVERPISNKVVRFINQLICKYVMSESATQNLPSDPVGKFNKIYKYYDFLATQCLRIKKFNKTTFQVLQFAGVAGLLYWIFF
ncbi:MAG: aspartyl/asparaginyl beta-hydroxylase domain-containing protein [Pseudomonadota bacterium]